MSVIERTRTTHGLLWLVVAGCLWGTGGLTGTLLAREAGLSSLGVAAARLGVGGLLLVAYLLVTRRAFPRGRAAWTRVAVVGLLAAEFQATYFAAVAHTGVGLATLLTIGASPVLVLAAEAVTGRRRLGARALATAAVALAGLALLVGVPSGGPGTGELITGGGFALLAAAGFATLTVVAARPVEGLDELAATGLGFTLGAVALAPLALAGGLAFTATPAAVGLLLLLGLGPTAIGYAAYFRGLRTTAAGTAALMALLEPLVGTALAVLILGERLGPAGWAGAALLIVALAAESRSGDRS
ncbi:DMT family transporter [Actinoplanes sp. M2I2]|uniref:DMT family transporter n=1 Tax=Actinoplanes sp. M2I2 TaxID=1734444 RepID=UPI00202174BB|nr:EamA family transporter [Actinoplanes sp. M2I2]